MEKVERVGFVINNGLVSFAVLQNHQAFLPPNDRKQIFGLMIEGSVYFCEGVSYGAVHEEFLTEDVLGQITNCYKNHFMSHPDFYNGIKSNSNGVKPVGLKIFMY